MGEFEMYLHTSHCHLVKNKSQNLLVDEWDQLPYPLIQPEDNLLYLEWSIILDETEKQVGTVALKQLPDMVTFKMIYHIDREEIGLDLMEELLKLQIDYSFNSLKIQRLMIQVRAINFDMIRILRRLGMRLEEKTMIHDCTLVTYTLTNYQQLPMMKMRSSSLVHSQVLQFVKNEEEIRILMQTGLRLNRNAPIDLMRDYHYRLFVNEETFLDYLNCTDWMHQFGDIVIVKKTILSKSAYLFQIQFQDGVRLDLEFISLVNLWGAVYEETLCRVILDKDGLLPPLDDPNDSAHYLQCPTEEEFNQLLNDIWWYQIEVAKALYRDEVTLVSSIYEEMLLERVTTLLSWKIGLKYEWKIDLGRKKRWLKRYLPESIYNDYLHLYPNKCYNSIWDRLFFMGSFIQKIAIEIAQTLGYDYDQSQGEIVTKFLHRINSLPDNATEFN